MNTIRLHGSLEKFGGPYRMDVRSVREAFRALCVQLEGFEQAVLEGAFRIVRRRQKDRTYVDERTLDLGCSDCVIEIYPAMVGAGKGALGKVLLGVAIIGLAVVTSGASLSLTAITGGGFGAAMGAGIGFMGITYGTLAAFGAMLAFGGLAMMFAPAPKAPKSTAADSQTSYILSGPVNSSEQGVGVPLNYGQFLVGSIVISSQMTIDQLLTSGETYDADNAWADYGFSEWPNSSSGITVDDVLVKMQSI